MARKRATLTDLLNNLTFRVLYDKYKLLTINSFAWENLPDGIQPRHIERLLFDNGTAVFFRAPGMRFMCLEGSGTGNVNVYGDPLAYRVHGYNYQRTIPVDQCVVIENNILRIPTRDFVLFYVNKLAEAERTMDVNVKTCKNPFVFKCTDKDLLTVKKVFQEVDGNVPAIFIDKGLDGETFDVFQTGVKFMGNDLLDYAHSVEGSLLTFLGINNSPVDKKERLITDEANANNELIESFSDLQLAAREKAVEEINKLFGLEIRVSRRSAPVEEVEQDELVHE